MASKILNKLRTIQRTTYLNPNFSSTHSTSIPPRNFLHPRAYSDVVQSKDGPKSGQNVNRASVSSLNQAELIKFSAIADTWWDADGPFKPLHIMNPTRLAFIRSTLCRHFSKDPYSARPFEGLKFVDVGCGGGILSEPLARMGATVTGVDAVDKNIKIARLHADLDPATSSVEYLCTTAEKLVEEQREFDAVLALEVIEHVADPAEFCKSL